MSRSAATAITQLTGAVALVAGLTLALGWPGALAAVGALLLLAGLLAEHPPSRPPRPRPRVIPHVPKEGSDHDGPEPTVDRD